MKLIEKLFVVIIGLLAITALTVFFVAPQALIDLLQAVISINLAVRLVIILVIDVAILALIYTRLRTPRVTSEGLIVKSSGAVADISVESARKLILAAVEQVPNVASASVDLKAVEGKADISLNVNVTGSQINVPQKQQEINRALKQVVNKQLGLDMRGQPRVHIHLQDEELPPTRSTFTSATVAPVDTDKTLVDDIKKPEKSTTVTGSTLAPAEKESAKSDELTKTPLGTSSTSSLDDDFLKSYTTNRQSESKDD